MNDADPYHGMTEQEIAEIKQRVAESVKDLEAVTADDAAHRKLVDALMQDASDGLTATVTNDRPPPTGYRWTGEFRKARNGDWYLDHFGHLRMRSLSFSSGGCFWILEKLPPPQPVTLTRWCNLYADDDHCFHKTRELADTFAGAGRIACVPVTITYTPGEGLEEQK